MLQFIFLYNCLFIFKLPAFLGIWLPIAFFIFCSFKDTKRLLPAIKHICRNIYIYVAKEWEVKFYYFILHFLSWFHILENKITSSFLRKLVWATNQLWIKSLNRVTLLIMSIIKKLCNVYFWKLVQHPWFVVRWYARAI